MNQRWMTFCAVILWLLPPAAAQDAASPPVEADSAWSLHFQATSIGQHHGSFPSPYEGKNSLPPHPESRVSLTATLFFAWRINKHVEIVFDPEVAGGKGFGDVTGIAGFPNGEITRVAQAMPEPYPARGYVRCMWALGPETKAAEDGPNGVAAAAPVRRFVMITGKFAITDFFDNNSYSHDPRSQFMNWALMSNGAWDYPADTRGYTIGTVEELDMRRWSFRFAHTAEPTVANGSTFDTRLAEDSGDTFEWEHRHTPLSRPGIFRVLAFANRERAGTYREAIRSGGTADLAPTRRPGTLKYGFGLNLEQSLTRDIGVFARYGWNDGKTESWAFTQIDRSLSAGASIGGRPWKRAQDRIGIASVRNYISGDQRCFLAAGGMGFIIGDGRLVHYRPETAVETYYALHVTGGWTATLDYQHIANPAYNHDRGPVAVMSLRLHWER